MREFNLSCTKRISLILLNVGLHPLHHYAYSKLEGHGCNAGIFGHKGVLQIKTKTLMEFGNI